MDFPSLKIDFIFKREKANFFSNFFSIKIGKTEFSFLINRSDNSSKYQKIHFNEFHDKIIVANNFTYKNMLECKIGCLGPQRGRLPWATQQIIFHFFRFYYAEMRRKFWPKAPAKEGARCQKNFKITLYI